jgi:septal ring factor EnvC (AmiA/AmiB activator)
VKRLFWIGVGVGVTVLVLRQVGRLNNTVGKVAHAVSPAGIADSITELATTAKELGETFRASIAENEAALTAALLPSEEERARAAQVREERRAAERRAAAESGGYNPDDENEFF